MGMWPDMKAWASMSDNDPLKRGSSSATHPSSPLRRYSPTTMAMAGLLLVGGLGFGYMMFSKDDRRDRLKARDDRHGERLAHRP